jgi:hypothetical protein
MKPASLRSDLMDIQLSAYLNQHTVTGCWPLSLGAYRRSIVHILLPIKLSSDCDRS